MPIAQSLLLEFDHEFATLRKTLERVPEGKGDYAPHVKSMSLGKLAGHLAELPAWATPRSSRTSSTSQRWTTSRSCPDPPPN
jgi:hypothetical protein